MLNQSPRKMNCTSVAITYRCHINISAAYQPVPEWIHETTVGISSPTQSNQFAFTERSLGSPAHTTQIGKSLTSLLGHNQEVSISICKGLPIHRRVGNIHVHSITGSQFWTPSTTHCEQALWSKKRRLHVGIRITLSALRFLERLSGQHACDFGQSWLYKKFAKRARSSEVDQLARPVKSRPEDVHQAVKKSPSQPFPLVTYAVREWSHLHKIGGLRGYVRRHPPKLVWRDCCILL